MAAQSFKRGRHPVSECILQLTVLLRVRRLSSGSEQASCERMYFPTGFVRPAPVLQAQRRLSQRLVS